MKSIDENSNFSTARVDEEIIFNFALNIFVGHLIVWENYIRDIVVNFRFFYFLTL